MRSQQRFHPSAALVRAVARFGVLLLVGGGLCPAPASTASPEVSGQARSETSEPASSAGYDRRGLSVGGGIFYAPEDFDHGIGRSDSEGLYGRLAYRFGANVAGDLRFDILNRFDAEGTLARGSVEPWAATANVRIFVLTGCVQPYLSMGFGALSARVRGTRFADASQFSVRETEVVFRAGGGLDVHLTPRIVLNLDAVYYSPGGVLDDYSFAALASGLELRF